MTEFVDLFMPDVKIDFDDESGISDEHGAPSTPSKMETDFQFLNEVCSNQNKTQT